jgi:hypothetical protein
VVKYLAGMSCWQAVAASAMARWVLPVPTSPGDEILGVVDEIQAGQLVPAIVGGKADGGPVLRCLQPSLWSCGGLPLGQVVIHAQVDELSDGFAALSHLPG